MNPYLFPSRLSEKGRNFSDPLVVKDFFDGELSQENVDKFAERFKNMTQMEKEEKVKKRSLSFYSILSTTTLGNKKSNLERFLNLTASPQVL